MNKVILVLLSLMALALAVVNLPEEYQINYAYKFGHSFRPPFYVVAQNQIPFWNFGGTAVATEEYIRLTPQIGSSVGYLWNKEPVKMMDWEVFLEFNIHGGVIGADGMAFWYVKNPGRIGEVFGNEDKWNGLAVMLDSFDNDDRGNNPHVGVIVNNGIKAYNKGKDGSGQEAAFCSYNFRNHQETVVMQVKYQQKLLTVAFGKKSDQLTNFYRCINEVYIGDLPKNGYFGITAATGEINDAHDIYSLNTYDLHPSTTEHESQEGQKSPEKREDHSEDLTEEEFESLKKILAKEDAKQFENNMMRLRDPLKDKYKEVEKDLDSIEKDNKKPSHKPIDLHVDIPKEKEGSAGSVTAESFEYILSLIKLMEDQQQKMLQAFDSILSSLDEEKEVQLEQYSTFAKSFSGIYENVIGRGDLRKLSLKAQRLEHLQPKIDIISRTIAEISNQVAPKQDSAHSMLNQARFEVENVKNARDVHERNVRTQVSGLDAKINQVHQNFQNKAPSGSIMTYIMGAQTLLFVGFVLLGVLTKKKKKY